MPGHPDSDGAADAGCPIHLELAMSFQLLKKKYFINEIRIFKEICFFVFGKIQPFIVKCTLF